MYALMGDCVIYFAYRRELPPSIRFGALPADRQAGVWPDRAYTAVDLAAVLGTIFGVATSLARRGAAQRRPGRDVRRPAGPPAQVVLVVVAVAIATVSVVSGVDRASSARPS
ncbi:hypothetical protein HBB16_21815 [Pseudonocardia sp. MCCB 268]|nr:hypothetical protein [Pseudonocardia cytotoxica]